MSPEPAEVQAAPWEPPRLLGTAWSDWQRTGLTLWAVVFYVTVLVMAGTATWLMPSTRDGPSLWEVRLTGLLGAAYFIAGHAVLALRVAATEPVGRKRMVQAAIGLMLGGVAIVTDAGMLWLTMPVPRLGSTVTLPHWVCVVEQGVAGYLLVIGSFGAADGFATAARVIYDEWNRIPPVPTDVPPARRRFALDQN